MLPTASVSEDSVVTDEEVMRVSVWVCNTVATRVMCV